MSTTACRRPSSLGCVLTPPVPEQVLTFPLSGLPSTVNQDVKISIALPSGETNALPR